MESRFNYSTSFKTSLNRTLEAAGSIPVSSTTAPITTRMRSNAGISRRTRRRVSNAHRAWRGSIFDNQVLTNRDETPSLSVPRGVRPAKDGCSSTSTDQATKGKRWMPWRQKAMKDVVSCDKPRGAANKL